MPVEGQLNAATSLSRSGGIDNLSPEDMDPNDPRREQLLKEQEAAQRAAAIKGSLTPSANLSSNMGHEPQSEPEASEYDHTEEASTDMGDHEETYFQPLRDPDAMIFPEASVTSSPVPDDPLTAHIQELFAQISAYQPETIELQAELKCFVPDYIPSIGDIDPMIKVAPPSRWPDESNKPVIVATLPSSGLAVLDEPAINQSDPAVLDLTLRALSKGVPGTSTTHNVRSIQLSFSQDPSAATGKKTLATWVQNLYDLHSHKPPDKVTYTRPMPEVEALMAEWPAEVDRALESKEVALPSPDIDLTLPEYSRLLCAVLDIPVHLQPKPSRPNAVNKAGAPTKTSPSSRAHIEALHVLFTVYSEFKNSQHFGRNFGGGAGPGGGVGSSERGGERPDVLMV
ncbi:Intraflagellar transport protein 46 [Rhizophlyctis rosea]|nr:Intraflagellar transport protein 46 [Rhizophlyctis rosea]